MQQFLRDTLHLDYLHPDFEKFIAPFREIENKTEAAKSLYLFVRDSFLYDPFHLNLKPEALKASSVLKKNRAWCVEKAIVFAAGLRSLNIPARLGYAIVKNHIGVDRLTQILKSNQIVFHGYVDVYLDEFSTWTKATPAFDQRVCKINKVEPLIWEGLADSLFQEFIEGKKFMEYTHDYGVFEDVPQKLMTAEMKKYYPHLFDGSTPNTRHFSFLF
jgi:hypothetical protein